MPLTYPDPFLEIRVDHLNLPLPVQGLCAGYDGGSWRSSQLADHLFNWLPYAALNQEHQLSFGPANFMELLKLAAAHIYHTKKTATRGELGELLFHLICVLHYGTVPVVCKLILKTSSNDTVKGFDGVHLVPLDDDFELWLGESKFYKDGKGAIKEAVASIKQHIAPTFLKTEKAMLIGHVAEDIPHRDQVIKLFKSQTSSDKLIEKSVFPVLIAYESKSVAGFKALCQDYVTNLTSEIEDLRSHFVDKADGIKLRFRLIFVPMGKKQDVIKSFDQKLVPFL